MVNFQADKSCTSALKDGYCYDEYQTLDLDNCWFMVDENDLDTSTATVDVTVFNRAMLKKSLKFTVSTASQIAVSWNQYREELSRISKTKSLMEYRNLKFWN